MDRMSSLLSSVGNLNYKAYILTILTGTSSIVHETTHQPLLGTLSAVVETCVKLRSEGHKVVLVSSGAIGVGMKRMEVPSRPKSLSGRQVKHLNKPKIEDYLYLNFFSVGIGCNWTRKIDRSLG